MTRQALPARRHCLTIEAEWQGHPITVSVGLDLTGTAREVFANMPKGGQMQAVVADFCVAVSVAMQSGVPPQALAASFGRIPDPQKGKGATDHASILGVVMQLVAEAGR